MVFALHISSQDISVVFYEKCIFSSICFFKKKKLSLTHIPGSKRDS